MAAFRDSLPAEQRHFVSRLEAFGDIVIGFSLSQTALQLALPARGEQLFADPLRYALFFFTFGLIAVYWLRLHAIFGEAFAPARADIVLLFGYLAFVALLPFALAANVRYIRDLGGARVGFALYTGTIVGLGLTSLGLQVRGLRRAVPVLIDPVRRRLWSKIVSGVTVTTVFAIALVVDVATNVVAGSLCLPLVAPITFVTRRVLGSRAPGTLSAPEVS